MKKILLVAVFACASTVVFAGKGGVPGAGNSSAGGGKGGADGGTASYQSLSLPDSMVVEATGASGATVNYVVSAADAGGNAVSVSCNPASGSLMGLGVTVVNCSTTEGKKSLRVSDSFSVTVVDRIAPALSLPASMSVMSSDGGAVSVDFSASAVDIVSGSVAVDCVPASGSNFAVGSHTVSCRASDDAGNVVDGSFAVDITQQEVVGAGDTLPEPMPQLSSVKVSWVPPSSREDGTPLSTGEIAGYEIYVIGEFSGFDQVISIDDPAVYEHLLSGLSSDTYYFSISAIDISGVYSQPSGLISVTVGGS